MQRYAASSTRCTARVTTASPRPIRFKLATRDRGTAREKRTAPALCPALILPVSGAGGNGNPRGRGKRETQRFPPLGGEAGGCGASRARRPRGVRNSRS